MTDLLRQVVIGDKTSPESIKAALLQKVSAVAGNMLGFSDGFQGSFDGAS